MGWFGKNKTHIQTNIDMGLLQLYLIIESPYSLKLSQKKEEKDLTYKLMN